MTKKIVRKNRIRRKIKAKSDLPILQIFRSNFHIYAQIIDRSGKVLAAAGSLKIKEKKNKTEIAEIVGKSIAEEAKKKKIQTVIFDRGGNKYHGRVAMLAKAARDNDLKF